MCFMFYLLVQERRKRNTRVCSDSVCPLLKVSVALILLLLPVYKLTHIYLFACIIVLTRNCCMLSRNSWMIFRIYFITVLTFQKMCCSECVFKLLTAVKMWIVVFWVVTLCHVGRYQFSFKAPGRPWLLYQYVSWYLQFIYIYWII
jgi:hypothetical protein